MLSKNFIAQSPFTATIALTAAAIYISREIRSAIEAGSTLLALNTQSSLNRLFEPCKELSRYWPNAEGVLKLFQSLLEKFESKVVGILRNTSTADGGGIREQAVTVTATRQENGACHGGDIGQQYPNFNAEPGIAADANPVMDTLDWQNVLFYNAVQ